MILIFKKKALLLTMCYLKSNEKLEIKFYLMVESKKKLNVIPEKIDGNGLYVTYTRIKKLNMPTFNKPGKY